MRHTGTIVKWNDEQGFGFIRPADGGRDLFVHASVVRPRGARPSVQTPATYVPGLDRDGRPRASLVELVTADLASYTRSRGERVATGVAAVFFAILGLGILSDHLPGFVLPWYSVLSAIAALAYRTDKHRAVHGERRIPENTLHLLEVLGGWPGALVAQWRLRHKCRKLSYQTVFWLAVLTNVGVLGTILR